MNATTSPSPHVYFTSFRRQNLSRLSIHPLLRAAVERHFEIIGEAMNRLARYDPDVAGRIGDYPRIIAFRNLLIHGYDLIDHGQVWKVVCEQVPLLLSQVESILQEIQDKPTEDPG